MKVNELVKTPFKICVLFLIMYTSNGCREYKREPKQHLVNLNETVTYKVRKIINTSVNPKLSHVITLGNYISIEPFMPLDEIKFGESSNEILEAYLGFNYVEKAELFVNICEDYHHNSKIYYYLYKIKIWYVSSEYTYNIVGARNCFTEAGMQEFERVVEQIECQKEKRGLLND